MITKNEFGWKAIRYELTSKDGNAIFVEWTPVKSEFTIMRREPCFCTNAYFPSCPFIYCDFTFDSHIKAAKFIKDHIDEF